MPIVLLLALHLLASPRLQVPATGPSCHVTSHECHVAHLRHLAHLHRLHLRHVERGGGRGTPAISPVPLPPVHGSAVPHGTLGCSGLETLWIDAGGNPRTAFLAAEIAIAESGGRQFATGLAGERGYWQIHPDHGALSTYDPLGNARAAVIISDDGRDWSAWTTYRSGAYVGRC